MKVPVFIWHEMPTHKESDIKAALSPAQYEEFCKFMRGQTIGRDEASGEYLTYQWDFDHFMAGLPPLD